MGCAESNFGGLRRVVELYSMQGSVAHHSGCTSDGAAWMWDGEPWQQRFEVQGGGGSMAVRSRSPRSPQLEGSGGVRRGFGAGGAIKNYLHRPVTKRALLFDWCHLPLPRPPLVGACVGSSALSRVALSLRCRTPTPLLTRAHLHTHLCISPRGNMLVHTCCTNHHLRVL